MSRLSTFYPLHTMTYAKHVPAAERTLRLLEILGATPEGLSAGELTEILQISRSSLFALLNTLKTHHYVEQSDNRGRYRAGPALYALTPPQRRGLATLIEAFQTDPELSVLNETVVLAQLDGPDTIIIALQEGHCQVRVVLDIGQRQPAHTTAAGRVLLAGLAEDAVERNLPEQSPKLAAMLAQIRQEGLAQTSNDEIVDLACPICPDGYQPTVALQISLPAFRRQPDDRLTQLLRIAASRLSYRLGAPIYHPYGQAAAQPVEPTTLLETAEINSFLQQGWGARLACIRKDGTPHVVPLWYEWDGEFFWITASANASWGYYVQENAWVSLTIDEPWPPLRRVLVIGSVQPVVDDAIRGGIAGLRKRLVARYLGRGANSQSMDQMQWQAFLITPKKIIGQQGLGQ